MACSSEFPRLASRNRFVLELELQGYEVDFVGAHLIIYGLPYLGPEQQLKYGDMATPVELVDDYRIDRPKHHQVWFRGDVPHGLNGQPLKLSAVANPIQVTPEFGCPWAFSFKVAGVDYESVEEKITSYIDYLTAPARHLHKATPMRGIQTKAAEIKSPLRYPDTLAARDGINDLSHKLIGLKVGIVGLGGTGSYILDFLSKTHLELIRLMDDDIIHVHTLFRMPGALGERVLGRHKVNVLSEIYSDFHEEIYPRVVKIDSTNTDLLNGLDFVFVAVDDGPSRKTICESLFEKRIAFVDVGMGLYRGKNGLNGMVRVASGMHEGSPNLVGTPFIPTANPADNEYRRQPQIGELNALNAAMSVLYFKQSVGIFERDFESLVNIFEIGTFELDHI